MSPMAESHGSNEWRACGADRNDRTADQHPWRETIAEALADLDIIRSADPRYDHEWIERRHVSAPVQERRVGHVQGKGNA
jgi:hypothetical protein